MTTLLIASQNQGKVKEIKEIMADLPIEVISAPDDFDVDETGTTFEENALLKARAYHERHPQYLVLADDSGLAVDALDGRPGVYSKRYANSDPERMGKLIEELDQVEEKKRTARFISSLALVGPGIEEVFEGSVEGKIAHSMAGTEGFGYDPVFIPEGYDRTFAQLGSDVKNTLSHRAKALKKVKAFLREKLT